MKVGLFFVCGQNFVILPQKSVPSVLRSEFSGQKVRKFLKKISNTAFFLVQTTFFKRCFKIKNRNVVEGDVEVCSVFVSITSAPSFLSERQAVCSRVNHGYFSLVC